MIKFTPPHKLFSVFVNERDESTVGSDCRVPLCGDRRHLAADLTLAEAINVS